MSSLEAAPRLSGARTAQRSRRRSLAVARLDRAELLLLAAFGVVSVWVLALDLYQVIAHGRVWTGTDGMYVVDQLQYLSWIESAAHHGLVANLFVLHGTPADYFQPAISISGLLTAAGLAPTLVLLLWKPVAVLALFFAVRAYAAQALPDAGRGARLAVLALALFYGSFSVVYGQFGVVGDLFPGFLSWGYPFALLGTAVMVFALLGYSRARAEGRIAWGPGLLGALAGSLHPWQGEAFVALVAVTELYQWLASVRAGAPRRPPLRLLGLTVTLALIPLIYYLALDRFDPSWALGRHASKHGFSALAIGLALAPLALVALLGYLPARRGPRDFTSLSVRLWPLVTLFVYAQSSSSAGGSAPLHAFDGVTLPLSVLAVGGCLQAGWRRLPHARLLAWIALLAACVPATAYELKGARSDVAPQPGNPNFISRDERAALDFLRHSPVAGGVFTRAYLGATVPGRTGRHTYTGDRIWSEPDSDARNLTARALLADQLPAAETRRILTGSGARFVLSDCLDDADLRRALGPLLQAVHRFGCATVWQLVPSAPAPGSKA
jgi:hypothetical protein